MPIGSVAIRTMSTAPTSESFSAFSNRLRDFHHRLLALDCAYVIVVGHGQFFRAYTMCLTDGFAVTPEWMARYRTVETGKPIANCEVIELSGETLGREAREAGCTPRHLPRRR